MNLKSLILKPIGALCFLTVISCNDNVTSDIEDIEESLTEDVETLADGTVFPKESVAEIAARIDREMSGIRTIRKTAAQSSSIPHYVGVISATGKCPYGVGEIRYYMDCQDNEKLKFDKNDTEYQHNDPGCYKSKGLDINSKGNVTWVVCIVDANEFKFRRMKYGYAIFDLSHTQYLNGAAEVLVHSDDEDNNNANEYLCSSYGFVRNESSPYWPSQPKDKKDLRNTEFWLYYFAPDPNSGYKLPNLGFEYDVFGNFDCCSYKKQNILITDSEDHKCNNYWALCQQGSNKKTENQLGENYLFGSNGKILKNHNSHFYFAIQSSRYYREDIK
ncbi:MAG: hypothetical protein IKN94_01850 [Salinivirgaceae bacterium]|nr:hypothetical protein [Salinivirgaceae bacterium]